MCGKIFNKEVKENISSMKDLSKMVQSCYDFYTKNSNMGITFKEIRDLQGKCDEFLALISNKNADPIDLENSLDSLVLCDEFLEVLAYTYNDEMTKQVDAFKEEGMVEYGLVGIKHNCASYEIYMDKLNKLSAKAKQVISYLKAGKADLSNLGGCVSEVEGRYRNVIKIINERNYNDKHGRDYTESVLNGRIDGHKEVLSNISNASSEIDSVIAYYTQLLRKIENEKEISTDLKKVARKEERIKLLENKN